MTETAVTNWCATMLKGQPCERLLDGKCVSGIDVAECEAEHHRAAAGEKRDPRCRACLAHWCALTPEQCMGKPVTTEEERAQMRPT